MVGKAIEVSKGWRDLRFRFLLLECRCMSRDWVRWWHLSSRRLRRIDSIHHKLWARRTLRQFPIPQKSMKDRARRTIPFPTLTTALVIHKNKITRLRPLIPRTRTRPRTPRRTSRLINSDIMNIHRPAESHRNFFVKRREVATDGLGSCDARRFGGASGH